VIAHFIPHSGKPVPVTSGIIDSFITDLKFTEKCWSFGNCRESPQYLAPSICKSFIAAEIQPDAAGETDRIGDPVVMALERLDLVVHSLCGSRRRSDG
jgi:hypothetical protein